MSSFCLATDCLIFPRVSSSTRKATMKYTRRITASAIISLAAVAALAGCDSTATPSNTSTTSTVSASVPQPTGVPKACTPKSGGKFKIGVVDIDEQTSFFTQMNKGIETVAKIAGASLQFVSGNDDSSTQVSGIENLTASGVNAIIVDPYDAQALIPALMAAKKAGIAVVATDGTVADSSAVDTQVGTANYEGGQELGKAFLKLTGGTGQVGIVGALNSSIQIQRQNGFQDSAKKGGMTIGTVVDGHNVNDKAQTAAENLLTASPDLKYLYATGSPALDGAIAAAKSQNATSRLSIVGWDLDASSAAAIQSGFVKEVIQQNTYGFGYEAAKAAINIACGGTSVPKTVAVPITIVNKSNLSKYDYYLKG
jgi:ribose transport system substrate-binding protein